MTIQQFAEATGYSPSYIGNACRNGKIPCDMWHGTYEIPSWRATVWRAKRLRKKVGDKTIHNSVSMFQYALDKYNAEHDTYYSYGQAVRLGILENG